MDGNMNIYIEQLKDALDKVEITSESAIKLTYEDGINDLVKVFKAYKTSRRGVYFCGNGGSAGIAQHMTADYLKNGGIFTQSLFGQATLTCLSNDLSYEYVFSKQLELMAKEGELLVALSSSGESENIVKAIRTIRKFDGAVITLTGFKENNRIRGMGDWNIYVPTEYYGIVESIHNIVLQQIVDEIVAEDGIALKMEKDM